MEQDHPTIVPPSREGTYDLVDLAPTPPPASPAPRAQAPAEPAPARAPATTPAPEPEPEGKDAAMPAAGGLFARLRGKAGSKPAGAKADPAPPPAPAPADAPEKAAPPGSRLRPRRRKRSWKTEVPAWVVSLFVHLSVLSVLALATVAPALRPKPADINAAPVDTALAGEMAEEMLHTYAEVNDSTSDQAVGPMNATATGTGVGLGTGSGPPSATPSVGTRGVGAGSLPDVPVVARLSPLTTMMPRMPSMDLGGGGRLRGDVTRATANVGEALDQLAREILRHLDSHKLLVVWLFDESASMKDDQQFIKDKFDRVASELKVNVGDDRRAAHALTHAIVAYGEGAHYLTPKPVDDIDKIGEAIDRIPVDSSGLERTCAAISGVIDAYRRYISNDRRMILVLVTDESGDDGDDVEEARQMAVSNGVPIYVIGRQSLFGYGTAHLLYEDPVTKDHYWPAIRRGPETAGPECLQWDGLHDRWDEQPSGFAPYELARLVKDTGGIYFLLPSEENMRVRQREKKYSMATLKEYVPDYKGRGEYMKLRQGSDLRRALFTILEETRGFGFRRHFPIDPPALVEAAAAEYPIVKQRLSALVNYEKVLRSLKVARDRETDRRWRAHYDLMLAQIVTYQIKAYEYKACLEEMVALAQRGQLKPGTLPVPDQLVVEWVLDHSKDRKAPPSETDKKYAEAEALLRAVIAEHPNTPWADLAQDELDRGFGVQRNEWHHNPKYDERASLVPNY
jgi:hypothetical protein